MQKGLRPAKPGAMAPVQWKDARSLDQGDGRGHGGRWMGLSDGMWGLREEGSRRTPLSGTSAR